MSQHDYNITPEDATTGQELRVAINEALQALASNNYGATAPPVTYPLMIWPDSGQKRIWQRNETNTAWIDKGPLSLGSTNYTTLTAPAGTTSYAITAESIGYEFNMIQINTTASTGYTVSIPDPALVKGCKLTFRKTNSGGGMITIDPDGAFTIDGLSTVTLWTRYASITLISDGISWGIIDTAAVRGTWTPVPNGFSGGSLSGVFSRVGHLIFFQLTITTNGPLTIPAGSYISGLPYAFTGPSLAGGPGIIVNRTDLAISVPMAQLINQMGSVKIYPYPITIGGTLNPDQLHFSGSYWAY